MASQAEQVALLDPQATGTGPGVVPINARCVLRSEGGHRAVLVGSVPLAHFAIDDRMAEAYAIVTLVEQGWADQCEVARAFGCSARTVRRAQRRFEAGGLASLGRPSGFPKGQARSRPARSKRLHKLKAEGKSNRAIGLLLGISEKAVRKQLARAGWKPVAAEQRPMRWGDGTAEASATTPAEGTPTPTSAPSATSSALPAPTPAADPNLSASATAPLSSVEVPTQKTAEDASDTRPVDVQAEVPAADPNLSASATEDTDEPLPLSFDTDPSDRRRDRLFAYLGLLHDAAPMFQPGERVPHAGVLLAVPALLASGVLECARDVYSSLGPSFYGLRTSLVTMLLMGLLRIKRPEALKEHPPDDLGRVLGLDRAPEVKTLRRKLARLASVGRAVAFGRALAERRVATRGAALGFLYVDGHVRVYHGKRVLPKAHVTQMRIAMPATTDYWINDADGDPLFVVTAEANAGLVKMLPPLLDDVRRLIGDRRITIVFDRGGWSPRLFERILAAGFDVLTYRKGRVPPVPEERFHDRRARIDGRDVQYVLADERVDLLAGRLELRQVTRLAPNGHQTFIVTSRFDLSDIEVAFRMFERWRQENFFKYLGEEYALDALVDYDTVPADATRDVPNPLWKKLDAELRAERAKVGALAARYGIDAFGNDERGRRTMRGFKIAHAAQNREFLAALKRYAALLDRRSKVPKRVPVQQTITGAVIKLATERKHLTNVLKMVAYQAESDLVRAVAPHYRRADDEGRTLIQSALASPADIAVTDTELRITLVPLSSPHRSRAIAALCEELNRTPVRFPGTRLTLRFGVHAPAS